MARSSARESSSKFLNLTEIGIFKAIFVLARTYAIAKNSPTKYAKYGFDFPEMIRIKVMNLLELDSDNPLVITFSNLILKLLDSPWEMVNVCTQYMKEMCQDCAPIVNRKEYTNVYEQQTR